MKLYKNKIKFIILILTAVVLFNSSVPGFAKAQTSVPPADTDEIQIDRGKRLKAQTDEQYCEGEYSNEVLKITLGKYKAVFYPEVSRKEEDEPSKCVFEPAGTNDLGRYSQPSGAAELENSIMNGKGFSQDDVVKKALQDDQEIAKGSATSQIIGWIINFVLTVVVSVLGLLAALAAKIMDIAIWNSVFIPYGNINIVNIGWGIVRDFANMFFILILIIIALGAILRIEKLDYRHLLPELVIMAILVNFSKVIAVTLIEFVSTISMIFYGGGLREILSTLLAIADPVSAFTGTGEGWQVALGQGLGKILYMLVATVSFIALAGLFIVRLVGLYVFIIFSPAYFVLDILPATKEFAHKFMHKFVEYLVWVPIALFMLKITNLIAQREGMEGFNTHNESFFTFFIVAAFMWATVLIAEHAGMVGGKAIAHAVEHGAEKLGHRAFEAGDMWLARGANRKGPGTMNKFRRGLSYMSVGSWKKGWDQRTHQIEHESYMVAAAQKQDALNKLISPIPGRGHTTDFGLKAEQQLVADEKKQIHTKNNTELIHGMQQALHANEGEKAFAYAQTLFQNYDGNEALSRLGYGTDHEGFRRFVDENFVPLLGQQKAYRLAYDLSRTAEEANHWNFARAYSAVVRDGNVEYVPNLEAGDEVMAEIAKMNPQQADRTLNRLGRGFVEVDREGVGRINLGLSAYGIANRRTIDPKAAGDTFNLNTGSNYMFNDSTNTLMENKPLWLTLANKFSKMSDQQINQTRNLISSPGYTAERDAQGNLLRYAANHPEVTAGRARAGQIIIRQETAAETRDRVFNIEQAFNFYTQGRISKNDLENAKDLRARIGEYAHNQGRADVARDLGYTPPTNTPPPPPVAPPTPPAGGPPLPPGWTQHGGGVAMPPDR